MLQGVERLSMGSRVERPAGVKLRAQPAPGLPEPAQLRLDMPDSARIRHSSAKTTSAVSKTCRVAAAGPALAA